MHSPHPPARMRPRRRRLPWLHTVADGQPVTRSSSMTARHHSASRAAPTTASCCGRPPAPLPVFRRAWRESGLRPDFLSGRMHTVHPAAQQPVPRPGEIIVRIRRFAHRRSTAAISAAKTTASQRRRPTSRGRRPSERLLDTADRAPPGSGRGAVMGMLPRSRCRAEPLPSCGPSHGKVATVPSGLSAKRRRAGPLSGAWAG